MDFKKGSLEVMLKPRIIARMDIKNANLIKSINLEGLKIIGNPNEYAKNYYEDGADEILFMDCVATLYGRNNLSEMIYKSTKDIFVPIAVGGGIRSFEDVKMMLNSGADKVVINTLCIENQGLINEAAKIFGSQCLVGSIDYYEDSLKRLVVKNGSKITEVEALSLSKKLEDLGIGEIMFNSINRDGMKKGYDIDFLKKASKEINIPIIVCGGAGSWKDMLDVVKDTNCDAVAASNIFHHVEYSTYLAKKFLYDNKLNFRKAELFHN